MSEWWTYTISDFLLFSPRTWFRLIEQYNDAFWPLHVAALLLGLLIIAIVVRPPATQGRVIAGSLALLWAWVAVAFLWRRYATINWAAIWFAAAFGTQALLLAWTGAVKGSLTFGMRRGARHWIGLALLVFAVVCYPWIAVMALGTIGALLLAEGRWRRRLMVMPVLWCLLSGAMLWALSREFG